MTNSNVINVDLSLLQEIWLPDFYFYELQSFEKHEIFRDIQGGLRIKKTDQKDTGSRLEIKKFRLIKNVRNPLHF